MYMSMYISMYMSMSMSIYMYVYAYAYVYVYVYSNVNIYDLICHASAKIILLRWPLGVFVYPFCGFVPVNLGSWCIYDAQGPSGSMVCLLIGS